VAAAEMTLWRVLIASPRKHHKGYLERQNRQQIIVVV
jgi:hypothetical protein